MNKGITLLILVAVLGAMALVLYSHSGSQQAPAGPEASPPRAQAPASTFDESGPASPLQSPQGDSGSLRRIDPPLSSARPAPDGAPVPVTLGPSGQPVKPAPTPPPPAPAPAPAPVQENKPVPAPRPPKAETPKAEEKPTPPKSEKPAPPAAPAPSAPSANAGTSAPPAGNRAPSGAPGLTPWETPPKGGTAAPAATPERNTAGQTQVPAPTAPTPPAVSRPEQRTATDPIRPAELSPTGSHTLKGISLRSAGQTVILRIEADGPFPYKTFALPSPDRLVVDLPGAWNGMKSPSVPANSMVQKVRLGQQPGGPRLVLDLSGPPKGHTVERSGNAVEIRVQ